VETTRKFIELDAEKLFGMRTPAEVYAEGRSKKPERKGRA